MSHDPNERASPQPGWPELQAQLDALRGHMEQILRERTDSTEVYGKFAGMADAIVARAPPELMESVNSELGAILRDLQLTGDPMD